MPGERAGWTRDSHRWKNDHPKLDSRAEAMPLAASPGLTAD